MPKFSKRLRELRESKDLSQQKFADKIGVSKSSINMYERGEREPGLETIENIADFFNVDLDYLLGKSDIPNKSLNNTISISVSKEDIKLTKNEIELIKDYRSLSTQGKEYIRQQMYMAKNIYQEQADLPNLEDGVKGA